MSQHLTVRPRVLFNSQTSTCYLFQFSDYRKANLSQIGYPTGSHSAVLNVSKRAIVDISSVNQSVVLLFCSVGERARSRQRRSSRQSQVAVHQYDGSSDGQRYGRCKLNDGRRRPIHCHILLNYFPMNYY